jgi:hypothetical protein
MVCRDDSSWWLPTEVSGDRHFGPRSLTILPTYRCSAACAQCCFGSNPSIEDTLSLTQIKAAIDEAALHFPRLKIVVFSGGECFLLGDDLFEAIAHAHAMGLMVRAVSNGFWAKSERAAARIIEQAKSAGLTELNLSTGRDHAQWVPVSSVVNAAAAAVDAGLVTFLTVEEDAPDSDIAHEVLANPRLQALRKSAPALFSMAVNSWMKFNDGHVPRSSPRPRAPIDERCTQLFENLVVTPHGNVAACCGLPFEYIPELRLGHIGAAGLAELYRSQFDDFLKWWIHTEGPLAVVRAVAPQRASDLERCNHICEACATLHRDPELREAVRKNFLRHVPRVLTTARTRLRAEALGIVGVD